MRSGLSNFKRRIQIPMSPHLHSGGPKLPLKDILLLKDACAESRRDDVEGMANSNLASNLAIVSQAKLQQIHKEFGEEGIFKLHFLAITSNHVEFQHFYGVIFEDLSVRAIKVAKEPLQVDNDSLRAATELNKFNHNFINCSHSRKIFNPGKREGYLVYGIGGSRILVSLPFIGASRFFYDVFANSSDVVTSLMARGYLGTFLMLDSVEGLNETYYDQPGWLLWFSIIAAHSDLIIFVRELGENLSAAQEQEIHFTPDRVPKKIVELNAGELSWARSDSVDPATPITHFIPGRGIVSEAEWEQVTRRRAEPFIKDYRRDRFPDDRLIVLHDDNRISEHTLLNAELMYWQAGSRRTSRWWPFGRNV